MNIQIKPGEVAVDKDYHYLPMSSCPINAKVQLLGKGGVSLHGKWDGKDTFWQYWAPLPSRPPKPPEEPQTP